MTSPNPESIETQTANLASKIAELAVQRAGVCGWRAEALTLAVLAAAVKILAGETPPASDDPLVDAAASGRLTWVTVRQAGTVHRADLPDRLRAAVAATVAAHRRRDPGWQPAAGFGPAVLSAVDMVSLQLWAMTSQQMCEVPGQGRARRRQV